MEVPKEIQEHIVDVLHEKLFWNGFTMQDPNNDDGFYVIDEPDRDRYMYRNTIIMDVVKDDVEYKIEEYL